MRHLYELSPLIGLGLNVVLAAIVLRRHLHSRLHHVFALFLVMMALWAFTIYGMRVSPTLAAALPWEKAILATLAFVAASFYNFVLLFTRAKLGWHPILAYSGAVLFTLLSLRTDLLVRGMKAMWYGHGFVFGPLMPFYIIIFYGFVVAGLYRLLRARSALKSSAERNRYLYMSIGPGLCLIGLLGDMLAANGVGIYPLGIPSNIAFSALCAYAITKYQLLDIRVVLRRGTAYVLVSAVAIGVYLGLALLAYLFLAQTWSLNIWLNVFFALLIAVSLQPTLRWAQNTVDRWFYRGRYDYLNALESLGQETSAITDLTFIATSIVNTVASAMHCRAIAVMLPDATGERFVTVASRGVADASSLRLSRRCALAWWLGQREELARQEVNVIPQLQGLTARETELLERVDVQLLVSLITREGLRGILVLGRKLSDQDYSAEESRTLRVVARQMAIALDNARLYDSERRARVQLEAQNRERTDFLNALLHEVKTPITAILVSSELLRDELSVEGSTIGDLVQNLDVAARNLDHRISELMDFGRLHGTGVKLDLQSVDVAGVARSAATHVTALLMNKQQTLEIEVAGVSDLTVQADPQRLLQVFLNLLTNASKFGPSGQPIYLRIYPDADGIIVEVKDSAAPIPANDREQLFMPYQQGERKGSGGLGLGLSICRRLVQLHGGKIWVESDVSGNTFKFSIPLSQEEQA